MLCHLGFDAMRQSNNGSEEFAPKAIKFAILVSRTRCHNCWELTLRGAYRGKEDWPENRTLKNSTGERHWGGYGVSKAGRKTAVKKVRSKPPQSSTFNANIVLQARGVKNHNNDFNLNPTLHFRTLISTYHIPLTSSICCSCASLNSSVFHQS